VTSALTLAGTIAVIAITIINVTRSRMCAP
jgi:hypothetical protein